MSAEERIAELKKTLEYHIDRYYNQDSPEISDFEYDMMMQELKNLEKEHPELVTPDSPTQRVGGTAKREAGVLVRHNVPMLSLQDVFSKEEVFNFVEEMQKQLDHPEFVVEYKIDGLSIAQPPSASRRISARYSSSGRPKVVGAKMMRFFSCRPP